MSVKRPVIAPVRLETRFCALVLAAGAGRRFGGAKLTAPWRGGVLLDGALGAAFASPVAKVVVVTGEDPGVELAARAFAQALGQPERLGIVQASDWRLGLSASLRAGIRAVPAEAHAAFVFLGDMPDIPHDLARRLAGAFVPHVQAVQPVHAGLPGHPVLLGSELFAAAMTLTGDRGAQKLLQDRQVRVAQVEVDDPGAAFDVDTPAALAFAERVR